MYHSGKQSILLDSWKSCRFKLSKVFEHSYVGCTYSGLASGLKFKFILQCNDCDAAAGQ